MALVEWADRVRQIVWWFPDRRRTNSSWGKISELENRCLLAATVNTFSPVVADQQFSVVENSPNGTLVGQVAFSDPNGDDVSLSITGGNVGGAFTIDAQGMLRVANQDSLNFEAISRFDLIVTAIDDGSPQRVGVGAITVDLLNQLEEGVLLIDTGTGETTLASSEGTHFRFRPVPGWQGLGDFDDVLAGDFSGDGIEDVAAINSLGEIYVSQNSASGLLAPVLWTSVNVEHLTHDINVGDFNGDGFADVISRGSDGYWRIQRSNGVSFAEVEGPRWSVSGWRDGEAVIGDFNGDGADDVALRQVVQSGFTTAQWYLGLGTDAGLVTAYAGAWNETAYTWHDLRVGDLDGDGMDEVVARTHTGGWFALELLPPGRFQMRYVGTWSSQFHWRDASVGDFNGDGKDDIVGWEDRGLWWGLEGSGTPASIKPYGAWSASADWQATAGDLNGDGRDDVIGFNRQTGAVWGLLADGTRFHATHFLGSTKASQNWVLLSSVEPPKPALQTVGTPDVVTASATGQYGPFQVTHTSQRTTPEVFPATFQGEHEVGTNARFQVHLADEFVPVITEQKYTLSGWAKSGNTLGQQVNLLSQQYFGYAAYDADLQPILPQHVFRFASAVDTQLAAPLSPGDMTITLEDATGWSNGGAAFTRSLAWYGYQDGQGKTYDDYTYTRNVLSDSVNGVWEADGISGNVITLNEPWAGPALPAGAAVRNATSGDQYNYVALKGGVVADRLTWSHFAAEFGGREFQQGIARMDEFRPGTAFIRPAILANFNMETGNRVTWRNVEVVAAPNDQFLVNLFNSQQRLLDLQFPDVGGDDIYSISHHVAARNQYVVDPYAEYELHGTQSNVLTYYEDGLGFLSFDIDGQQIHPLHVTRFQTATDTTLAAPLAPGDMAIYVTDATGWSNELWQPAQSRSLAWYGYQDSTGRVYDDFTYTRNVAFDFENGLWDAGGISFDTAMNTWKIDLNAPWAGPALSTGAAIRNADNGNAISGQVELPGPEVREKRVNVDNKVLTWPYAAQALTSTFGGGEWEDGVPDRYKFMPGTFSIQPIAVAPNAWTKLKIGVVAAPEAEVTTVTANAEHQVALLVDVLANDVAVDVLAEYEIIATAGNPFGDVEILPAAGINGQDLIRYTSPAWFSGTDAFTYTARHRVTGETIKSTAKVHLLGNNLGEIPELEAPILERIANGGDNIAPVAFDDGLWAEYTVRNGATLISNATNPGVITNDGDQDGDTIAVELIVPPAHGKLSFHADGHFEYRPDSGYTGRDTFRYQVTDGLASEPATVHINVHATDVRQTRENLYDIVIGLYNHHDVYNRFPARDTNPTEHDPETGWSYLSWRVQILPYLGYQELYNQFHLDEPWDSPHNIALLDQMPDVFRSSGDSGDTTTTRMQIFRNVGDEFYWRNRSTSTGSGNVINIVGSNYRDFTDNVNNTALVIEVGTDKAVPWTQPDQDVLLDPDNALASLGDLPSGLINMVMADGTVMTLSTNITDAELTALATLRGGELVNAETLQRREALNPLVAQVLDGDSVEHTERSLKRLGLGLYNYHDVFNRLPVSDSPYWYDADGRPFLSWRVHLLPYIGERQLYNQFHLDEPWDSPHNIQLMQYMPDIYRSNGDAFDSTTTRMQTFNGPEALFEAKLGPINTNSTQRQGYVGPRLWDIKDGYENTILVAEIGADRAVPWTKPQDVTFDLHDPLAGLGAVDGEMRVLIADGAVGTIDMQISPEQFAAFVTPDVSRIYALSEVPGEELVALSSYFNRMTTEQNEINGLYGAAQRRTQVNKAKQIGLGLHNYHDTFNRMAVTNHYRYYDDNGVPFLSWRVHLLPFLGYANLYNQFNLEEPWDSPTNIKLIQYMPDLYRSIGDAWDSVTTRFQTFFGEEAAWGKRRSLDYSGSGPRTGYTGPRFSDIRDGTSNTIAVVEAGRDKAVIWTKPEDIPFDPNDPFAAMGDIDNDFLALFFDGYAERLDARMSPEELTKLITPAGGEVITPRN